MNISHRIEIANPAAPIQISRARRWASSSHTVSGTQVSSAISAERVGGRRGRRRCPTRIRIADRP